MGPSLFLREGSRLHNFDLVADSANFVLVVCMNLQGTLNDLAVHGVLYVVLDSNYNSLVHLVANNSTYAYFSEISFFCHDYSSLRIFL